MPEKPGTAEGYRSDQLALVRTTCLYVATKLGDLSNELVVVGGLVPSLLIDQHDLPAGADAHAGTIDLDLGMTLAVLKGGRYRRLTEALRSVGFSPDTNSQGHPTFQRWKAAGTNGVKVDFLIPPSLPSDQGGNLRTRT
ncbi:MAG TPA: hypothetical protein VJQ57_09615 [Acidimicrobiia bacterium]|nr:hypothetical protein [Acidimicrobiia bacterium]